MSEWIKTSERLPEKYVYVLLYVDDGEDKYITYGCYQTYNDIISEFLAFDDEYLDVSKVLYWMPLPEPPKGE